MSLEMLHDRDPGDENHEQQPASHFPPSSEGAKQEEQPGLSRGATLLTLQPPIEIYREARARGDQSTFYLFVHCGRESLSNSHYRYCPMCGAQVQGDPYAPELSPAPEHAPNGKSVRNGSISSGADEDGGEAGQQATTPASLPNFMGCVGDQTKESNSA